MEAVNFSRITACGECCDGCEKKDNGLCQGCIESDGNCKEWAQSGGCPIYKCAKRHNVQFCGLCAEFPCEWLVQKITWNPDAVSHLTALAASYRKQPQYRVAVSVESFSEAYMDDIRELDTYLWLEMNFNGDFKPENTFLAFEGGKLAGACCLSYGEGWHAMERDDITHKLRLNLSAADNLAAKGALLDAAVTRLRVLGLEHPGKSLCISTYLETDELEEMRMLMSKGFGFYGVSPVLKFGFDGDIPYFELPKGMEIVECGLDEDMMQKYMAADEKAFGKRGSEAELSFNREGPGFRCLCAMSGGEIAGSITIWDIDEERSATENIFTVPEFRNKGVARALISAALSLLKNSGKKIATLSMGGENINAMRLYLSCGYELYYNLLEMRRFTDHTKHQLKSR